jgi:hypothetical protein
MRNQTLKTLKKFDPVDNSESYPHDLTALS